MLRKIEARALESIERLERQTLFRSTRSSVLPRAAALLLAAAFSVGGDANGEVTLSELTASTDASGDEIRIQLDGAAPDFRWVRDADDTRLDIDLDSVRDPRGERTIAVSGQRVGRIRVLPLDSGTRISIEANSGRSLGTRLTSEAPDGVVIRFGSGAAWPAQREVGPPPEPPKPLAAPAPARGSLIGIEALEGDEIAALRLRLRGPTGGVSIDKLSDPERLVIDLRGVRNETGSSEFALASRRARRVQIQESEEPGLLITRLIVTPGNARAPFDRHGITPIDGGLLVTLGVASLAAWDPTLLARGSGEPELPPVAAGPVDSEPDAPGPIAARAGPEDGPVYRVDHFEPRYALPHPDHPDLDALAQTPIRLSQTEDGFVAERPGLPLRGFSLEGLGTQSERRFYASALQSIIESLLAEMNRRGYYAVFIQPHEEDIEPGLQRDLRPPERGDALRLLIWTGRLLEFRTFASGNRIAGTPEERTDHPLHQRIKEASPVQPNDLVRARELDDYAARLSRHPGREVEYRLSKSPRAGNAYLDFLVAESKPWTAYVQGSNTGTESTGLWRERFGLSHTQLTGRDDVLNLDYITGGFDEVHAFFGSYELPIYRDRVRLRVGGAFSEYQASQLGFVKSRFDGTQWDAGFELIGNLWQRGPLFLDLFSGARFQHISVENRPIPLVSESGDADLLLPELGIRIERDSELWRLRAALSGEWNLPNIAGTDADDLALLGRNRVDETAFELIRWAVSMSFYLDPLVARLGSAAAAREPRLAHEIALSTRGQHSFGNRLAPQLEQVAGGVYSTRGYDQSIVAGDTLILGRGEYRLHLPRLLPLRPPHLLPGFGDFHLNPEKGRRPDWDLVLVSFFDLGRTAIVDRGVGEYNELLLSTGLGVELRVIDNLILDFDWGRALREARNGESARGDHEFHFQGTLLY